MQTTIKINTDLLNMDTLEGIKKMFPRKLVKITVEEEYVEDEDNNGDEEDATQFILNRPAFAAELLRRIKSIESNEAQLVSVNLEDLVQ